MKVLYLQGLGGASGDMILGALSAVGADLGRIEKTVSTLVKEPIRITAKPYESHGLNGTQVFVDTNENETDVHPPHRNLHDIREIIARADLSDFVREHVLRIFSRLAEAEAHVHNQSIDAIHFHEVGALDSIVDIVGVCMAIESFKVDAVSVAPLSVGQGTVTCKHGLYPTPAPATVQLLEGFPITFTDEPYELVTPTGAALLTTWHTLDRPPPGARIRRAGYGFGHRALDHRPNVLRAVLLETDDSSDMDSSCLVLECQIDDTTPELLGVLGARLFQAGALDVLTIAAQMKKQRPGVLLKVLCRPIDRDVLINLIFRESTTFGIREYLTHRTMLERNRTVVETEYGPIRVKVGSWLGEEITAAPEMEDCILAATKSGISVRSVYESAQRVYRTEPRQPSF